MADLNPGQFKSSYMSGLRKNLTSTAAGPYPAKVKSRTSNPSTRMYNDLRSNLKVAQMHHALNQDPSMMMTASGPAGPSDTTTPAKKSGGFASKLRGLGRKSGGSKPAQQAQPQQNAPQSPSFQHPSMGGKSRKNTRVLTEMHGLVKKHSGGNARALRTLTGAK